MTQFQWRSIAEPNPFCYSCIGPAGRIDAQTATALCRYGRHGNKQRIWCSAQLWNGLLQLWLLLDCTSHSCLQVSTCPNIYIVHLPMGTSVVLWHALLQINVKHVSYKELPKRLFSSGCLIQICSNHYQKGITFYIDTCFWLHGCRDWYGCKRSMMLPSVLRFNKKSKALLGDCSFAACKRTPSSSHLTLPQMRFLWTKQFGYRP